MSTRACIGRRDGDSSWAGYYVHSDGYPDVTGRVLVEMIRDMGAEAVLAYAATAPQGWTHFPDEPSVYHDEPFMMTPQHDGGSEWLYLITDDHEIKVYKGEGWGDPGRCKFTRVGTIDPGHPNAAREMAALTHVSSIGDGVPVRLEAPAPTDTVASSPESIPSWHERVRDMRERATILAPLRLDRPASVSVPDVGAMMTPDDLVASLVFPHPGEPHLTRGEEPRTWRDRVSSGGEP